MSLAKLGDLTIGDTDCSSALSRVDATSNALSNNSLSAFNGNSLIKLNFDFTLVKFAAPKEYEGVGNTLSERRKKNAESGMLHRTARKLGALFEGLLPTTPDLVRAYGERVSEICKSEKVNPRGSFLHGIFSKQVGVDSASIWAAVTSGDAAIAVHLLACMLARIWNGPEATSLWTELIRARKAEIEREIENATQVSKYDGAAWAAQQDISRDEIANWDDSARSWLQSADLVLDEKQRKVLHLTQNFGKSVNEERETYKSAIHAWTDALTMMNALVAGRPQKIRDGSILLALTSWHLYPNLQLFPKNAAPVTHIQDDQLVTDSGVLSIGLETVEESQGSVTWSLPLAYMKFYGDPVRRSKIVSQDTSRITMNQFSFVLLGSVFTAWDGFGRNNQTGLKWAIKLSEVLRLPDKDVSPDRTNNERMTKLMSRSSWVGQLLKAADEYAESNDVDRGIALKLMGLGRRQNSLLGPPSHCPFPLFGLCQFSILFRLIDNVEVRIDYLRKIAKELELLNDNCIIEYSSSPVPGGSKLREFASLGPDPRISENGFIRRKTSQSGKCVRWISMPTTGARACNCKGSCPSPKKLPNGVLDTKSGCPCWSLGGCSLQCHSWKSRNIEGCLALLSGQLSERMKAITDRGEICLPVHEIRDFESPLNGCLDFGTGITFQASLAELYEGMTLIGEFGGKLLI